MHLDKQKASSATPTQLPLGSTVPETHGRSYQASETTSQGEQNNFKLSSFIVK